MIHQYVRDYEVVSPLKTFTPTPQGDSVSPKGMIFHILDDNTGPVEVLDIGFGTGTLGALIKGNEATAHWSVDGIDGWDVNCNSTALLDRKLYRNLWHGLAQELPSERIASYRIICLLDVIEHLTVDTAKWLLRTLLTSMGEDARLFISTPLWFYPQDQIQEGDLEAHLIGVPASSMMALIPTMYAISNPLIGGFVLTKQSLDYIEFFHPTADKTFNFERGLAVVRAVNMQYRPGVVFKVPAA